MIYLLNAIGLSPGGSSTVHIYTQTIHQKKKYIEQHNNLDVSTKRVVGRHPNAPAAFTPGEIPGTHFQRLSRPQGTWFCRGYHGRNSQ